MQISRSVIIPSALPSAKTGTPPQFASHIICAGTFKESSGEHVRTSRVMILLTGASSLPPPGSLCWMNSLRLWVNSATVAKASAPAFSPSRSNFCSRASALLSNSRQRSRASRVSKCARTLAVSRAVSSSENARLNVPVLRVCNDIVTSARHLVPLSLSGIRTECRMRANARTPTMLGKVFAKDRVPGSLCTVLTTRRKACTLGFRRGRCQSRTFNSQTPL